MQTVDNNTSHSTVLTMPTVRHVACSLMYCCESDNPTEGAIRKQILVSSAAGYPPASA